jgi:hypothetical protein
LNGGEALAGSRVSGDLVATRGLHTLIEQMFLLPSSPKVIAAVNRSLFWGQATVTTLMTTFVVLTATLYLLLDGRRLYAWLLAYVPRSQREKMALTMPEVSKVVYAYVRGQFITLTLFAAFVAITLWSLNVPGVLPLSLLAAVCDVVPLVGIVVATMPAALLALTVTPYTSGVVVGAYGFYHLFETSFIVPRVYGSTMRLSALAVLLALIVGSALQGLLGAVLVLPLVRHIRSSSESGWPSISVRRSSRIIQHWRKRWTSAATRLSRLYCKGKNTSTSRNARPQCSGGASLEPASGLHTVLPRTAMLLVCVRTA